MKIVIDPAATNPPLGYRDSATQASKVADGRYQVYVGRSAGDVVFGDSVTVRTPPGRAR
jgi:hypothetical protein